MSRVMEYDKHLFKNIEHRLEVHKSTHDYLTYKERNTPLILMRIYS